MHLFDLLALSRIVPLQCTEEMYSASASASACACASSAWSIPDFYRVDVRKKKVLKFFV